MPAPPFLIRFYRQHFTRFAKSSNVTGAGGSGSKYGSSRRTGGTGGQGGYQGSFTTVDEPNGSITLQEGSRVGRVEDGATSKRGSLEKPSTSGNTADNQINSSPPQQTSGLRLFHSRHRGTSSDSDKIFNRDFDQEDPRVSQDYQQEPTRPDSFDQYYNNMRTARPDIIIRGSIDLQTSSSRPDNKDRPDDGFNEKLEMNGNYRSFAIEPSFPCFTLSC